MAKKSRTPAPPRSRGRTSTEPRRPVQAPKVRSAKRAPRDRGRLLLYALALSGLAALGAVVLLIFVLGGGGGNSLNDKLAAGGCTLTLSPGQFAKSDHSTVPTVNTKVKWNTSPPANGPHYGVPAVFGFYDDPVKPTQAVHNLEHGAIVIWYGEKISPETKQKLRDFYNEDPRGMLVTPYPNYGSKIALSAWTIDNPLDYFRSGNYGEGHLASCTKFNEGAFKAFRDQYRAKGPERFPIDQLTPGG